MSLSALTITTTADIPGVVRELEAALATGPVTLGIIEPEGLTPTEAGRFLGVSRQFIDRLLGDGKLAYTHLPNSTHRRIPAGELQRFAHQRDQRRQTHREAVARLDAARVPWE